MDLIGEHLVKGVSIEVFDCPSGFPRSAVGVWYIKRLQNTYTLHLTSYVTTRSLTFKRYSPK
jgi:hypothetical protein